MIVDLFSLQMRTHNRARTPTTAMRTTAVRTPTCPSQDCHSHRTPHRTQWTKMVSPYVVCFQDTFTEYLNISSSLFTVISVLKYKDLIHYSSIKCNLSYMEVIVIIFKYIKGRCISLQ